MVIGNRFANTLEGVFLTYSNVMIEQEKGKILNEAPHIHFMVSFDAVVFKPEIGARISIFYLSINVVAGTVNKISSDHIGLLVLGIFNASIHSFGIPTNFQKLIDRDAWVNTENESQKIEVGDTVEFTVVKYENY